MFDYSDPTSGQLLQQSGAIGFYRLLIDALYDSAAQEPRSACTWLEALDDSMSNPVSVDWKAFPITANATDKQIDARRFALQDEYIEWHVRNGDGGITITFCTDFPEYYQSLAAVGFEVLREGIAEAIPEAVAATPQDLFGSAAVPPSPRGRSEAFRRNLRSNPWNNGDRSILCLTHRSNTLGALFGLALACSIKRQDVPAASLCANVDDACVPGRNSDPIVCQAAQEIARADQVFSFADPVGIRILQLDGIWKLNGATIDINDPTANGGVWTVSRNGRRAVLTASDALTVNGTSIVTGAQVSQLLSVSATVRVADSTTVPDWAKTGKESLGRGGN